MLRYLVERQGRVVSRHELLREIWGYPDTPATRSVDHAIARLRKKIEPDPGPPALHPHRARRRLHHHAGGAPPVPRKARSEPGLRPSSRPAQPCPGGREPRFGSRLRSVATTCDISLAAGRPYSPDNPASPRREGKHSKGAVMLRSRTVILALMFVVVATAAFAQGNPTGTITGRVTDPDNLALARRDRDGGRRRSCRACERSSPPGTATTSSRSCRAGDYTVTFELQGFATVKQAGQPEDG